MRHTNVNRLCDLSSDAALKGLLLNALDCLSICSALRQLSLGFALALVNDVTDKFFPLDTQFALVVWPWMVHVSCQCGNFLAELQITGKGAVDWHLLHIMWKIVKPLIFIQQLRTTYMRLFFIWWISVRKEASKNINILCFQSTCEQQPALPSIAFNDDLVYRTYSVLLAKTPIRKYILEKISFFEFLSLKFRFTRKIYFVSAPKSLAHLSLKWLYVRFLMFGEVWG